MKKFKDIRPEWNDERMDIIGQNGNDGLHYEEEEVAEGKVPFDPPYNKIKDRRNSDKTKTSGFSIAKQLAKSAMKTAKKEAYTGGPHDANWVNKSEKLERARDRAKRMGDQKKHAELDAQIKQHYKRGPGVREGIEVNEDAKVIAHLVKKGLNPKDAEASTKKHLPYVKKAYGNLSPAQAAAKVSMARANEGKQLDELDQATIGSYMKKAHNQIGDLNKKAYKKDPDHGDPKNLSKPDQKKLKKRAAGTDRAWTNYVARHTGINHDTGKGFGRMRNSRGMGRDYKGPTGSLAKKNESVEYDLNEELMFKVKIEGLPAMIMSGKSPADIKAGLRKILKKQDSIKDIPVERLSKAEVKKRYRDLAGEKIDEAKDSASPDEKSMALKQCEYIEYVGRELCEYVGKNKEFPEWMQNKLSELHQKAKDLHANMGDHGNDDKEETNESNVYFGTYNKRGDRDKGGISKDKKSMRNFWKDMAAKRDERMAAKKEEVDKEKRLDTIRKAQMKAQEKRRKAEKRAQKAAMADMDEASSCGSKRKVNELSKDTLSRYIGSANDDKKAWKDVRKAFARRGEKDHGFENSKIAKRNTGIKKAAFKLTKKR